MGKNPIFLQSDCLSSQMADEENLPMVEDNDDSEPALISTPTQDELPDFISLPGVSASGIQAAASALRGIRTEGIDEISDSELNVDQDLGDLAVLPVEKPDEEDRLSGVSNVSSVKEKENGKKDDDEISLSGLSSNDDDPSRLQIEDVEDGEITKVSNNPPMNVLHPEDPDLPVQIPVLPMLGN